MKHAIRKPLALSLLSVGWAATLLLALSGCDRATGNALDAIGDDSAASPKADAAAPGDASDGSSPLADARGTDSAASQADAGDANVVRADAVAPDAAPVSADAVAPDTAPIPADAAGEKPVSGGGNDAAREAVSDRAEALASDGARRRADAAALRDASPEAVAADTLVEDPDAEVLPCQAVVGPATLGHLTPLELKTILDGSEDPYLINVKGPSIANIPGTDAVLVDDVPGIEALVGGDLCADIILYCRSGNTSQTVGNQLIAKGYLRVRDLEGGITAWTAAGYPTE